MDTNNKMESIKNLNSLSKELVEIIVKKFKLLMYNFNFNFYKKGNTQRKKIEYRTRKMAYENF